MRKTRKFGIAEDEFVVKKGSVLDEATSLDTEVNADDQPSDIKDKLIYIHYSDLLDDPDEAYYYGDAEAAKVDALAEAMKREGFQGVVLAYPSSNGKYIVESGHRRKEAAKKAGIYEIPVYVTQPPVSDWERRLRLFGANMNDRGKDDPSVMRDARVAQGLFEAYQASLASLKESGSLAPGEKANAGDLAAARMGMTRANLARLRSLLKLIPRLQDFAEEGKCSWAELSSASVMDPAAQEELADSIEARIADYGVTSVTQAWLRKEIDKMKNMDSTSAEELPPRQVRLPVRRDAVKLIDKGAANLAKGFGPGAAYRKEDVPYMIEKLEELSGEINKRLEELRKAR